MNIDQLLGLLLILALLVRYHRYELRKAEERFEKCDKERVLLHNLYYQKFGGDFETGGAQSEQLIEREPETPESRYKEAIQRTKLELKRLARTRPAHLGRGIRQIEQRGRPNIKKMMPRMDPGTAQQAANQVKDLLAEVEQTVKNGRPTHAGG